MVTADTVEGVINDTLSFHYDLTADVLYLKLISASETHTYANLTDDGDLLLRDQSTDQPVGLTIVSWWKRFGRGLQPDSVHEIAKLIEPWTDKFAA